MDGLQRVGEATGLTLKQVVLLDEGIDALADEGRVRGVDLVLGVNADWMETIGWDSQTTPVAEYGQDEACLFANRLWFSANNLPLPSDVETFGAARLEGAVAARDPLQSPPALVALAQWDPYWAQWEATGAGEPATEDAALVPGYVGSALAAKRQAESLDVAAQFRPLETTCVPYTLAAAALPTSATEDVESLLEFFLSEDGQRLLAETTIAQPLDENEPAESFNEEATAAALARWELLFRRADPR